MSSYKVAQDVEADDKLLGPFSFRQFIYLIVVAMSGLLAWGLSTLLLPLAIIPLPAMLFFGVLALPLRKDQPMETYLAAMISFYLKPRKRLWVPDGIESLVEITAPQVEEVQLTKNLSEHEAARRLSYLADLSDSQGWSIRNAPMPSDNSSMHEDLYNEAQQAEDLLDAQGAVARSFEDRILQADNKHRQELLDRMNQQIAASNSATTPEPVAPVAQVQQPSPAQLTDAAVTAVAPTPVPTPAPAPPVIEATVPAPTPVAPELATTPPVAVQAVEPVAATVAQPEIQQVQFNPYPTSIRQSVVQPLSEQHHHQVTPPTQATPSSVSPTTNTPEEPSSTSANEVTPDIINLANNSDLSVETIAREANRLSKKKQDEAGDEVVISLR